MPPVESLRIPILWALWAWLERGTHDKLTTLLLAGAALATSWSSYEASRWGGVQDSYYSQASSARTRAAHTADNAMRLRMMDIGIFMNWLNAYADDKQVLKEFYERRFRPEFRPAFRAWLATHPLRDSTSGSTPFQRPEYRLALDEETERLVKESMRLFEAGQQANANSDGYVFDTVILATVLFFTGALGQIVRPKVRGAILGMACVLLVLSVVRLAMAPVASG